MRFRKDVEKMNNETKYMLPFVCIIAGILILTFGFLNLALIFLPNPGPEYLIPTVEQIQAQLCELGYPVAIDGIFGDQTQLALNKYHRDHNPIAIKAMKEALK